MKLLEKNYLLIIIVSIIIGVILNLYSWNLPQEISTISCFIDGKVDIIHPRILSQVLNIISIFLYTFGISIFISFFIISRIEAMRTAEQAESQSSRHEQHERELKKLNEAISLNIFDSLFKKLMPEELFIIVKETIINSKIIRRNASWDLDFDLVNDHILLRQTISYELENVSNEKVINPNLIISDNDDNEDILLSIVLIKNGCREIIYDKNKGINSQNVKLKDNGDNKTDTEVNVEIEPKSKIDMIFVWQVKYHKDFVRDAYFSLYPIINAELNARFPVGYKFNIFPAMSNKLEKTLEEDTRVKYKVYGGILPEQGFVFELKEIKHPTNP